MGRLVVNLAMAALGAVLWSETAAAQAPEGRLHESSTVLVTSNRVLQASLNRIASRSTLWRSAIEEIHRTGRQALILTADQVVVADTPGAATHQPFDATQLAEVAPVPRDDGRVQLVMVVVNLGLLEQTHRDRRSLPWELQSDLDRVLVHEIYGHAFPYLIAGDRSGRCADPRSGERAADACSIRRENAVRAELGLGRRTDSGLDGLVLSRSQ